MYIQQCAAGKARTQCALVSFFVSDVCNIILVKGFTGVASQVFNRA